MRIWLQKFKKLSTFLKNLKKNAQKTSEYKYVYSLKLCFLIFLLMHTFYIFYYKWKLIFIDENFVIIFFKFHLFERI